MEFYNLKENEVVLYKGDIVILKNYSARIILTNLNIVFIQYNKESIKQETAIVEIYPIEDIKIYKDIPQVKKDANNIEIYFKQTEKEFSFNSKKELNKFLEEVNKLLTGKNKIERNAEKIKKTINLVNDTFGVDLVKSTGNMVKNGLTGTISGSLKKLAKPLKDKIKK